MSVALFALQNTQLGLGILVAIVLATALLVPYLIKEIGRGKVDLGPQVKETAHGIQFGADTVRSGTRPDRRTLSRAESQRAPRRIFSADDLE